MKLALIGYGKMGKMVESASVSRGHQITAIIDPSDPKATAHEISVEVLRDADVCIDFSHPLAVLENTHCVAKAKKALVIGTTGWDGQKQQVQTVVESAGIGAVYGANFSIGVHLFLTMAKQAAQLINSFPDYDVGCIESHHNQKADSPSGTAKLLAEQTLQWIQRKKTVVYNPLESALDPAEIQVSSFRCGHLPGTHTLIFDSPDDTIEIIHTARSRAGFAKGAVEAAEWIRARVGFYSIEDWLKLR